VVLTALAVALGAYHGLVGLLGLILVRTGPEPWDVLIMSVALASTPAALTLAAWGARRLAAAWLALAALAWAVFGYRGVWPEWAYSALYYAPQVVAALVLSRRRPGAASALAATPATPHVSSPTARALPGRRPVGLRVPRVVVAPVSARRALPEKAPGRILSQITSNWQRVPSMTCENEGSRVG
jgi:hypothetical protein